MEACSIWINSAFEAQNKVQFERAGKEMEPFTLILLVTLALVRSPNAIYAINGTGICPRYPLDTRGVYTKLMCNVAQGSNTQRHLLYPHGIQYHLLSGYGMLLHQSITVC